MSKVEEILLTLSGLWSLSVVESVCVFRNVSAAQSVEKRAGSLQRLALQRDTISISSAVGQTNKSVVIQLLYSVWRKYTDIKSNSSLKSGEL